MKKQLPQVAKNTLPILYEGSTQSLEAYIHFANSIPMLTPEEEHELAEQLRLHNDIEAAQKLILAHLRFVVKVARGFSGYGLSLSDLIQEGNIGLMKAVKRFDPTIGVRLVTFAVHWIKAEIHDFVIKNWRIVKIATTKSQRKLFFNLRSSKDRLGWFSDEEIQNVAQALNVKPEEVIEMEKRMNAFDMAYDGPDSDDDDSPSLSPSHYLADLSETPEAAVISEDDDTRKTNTLLDAIDALDPRSQAIIKRRWLAEEKKATLHELAAEYDISAERVRQLEAQALKQLKACFKG